MATKLFRSPSDQKLSRTMRHSWSELAWERLENDGPIANQATSVFRGQKPCTRIILIILRPF